MREILHLTRDDARVVPWKNGRGTTSELCVWPAGTSFERGDFDLRVSRAAVVEDGPFSVFPGFERILVVTHGAGLELRHDDSRGGGSRARLRPLEPYGFPGDVATTGALVGGAVRDFNVFARRGRLVANAEVIRLGTRRARELAAERHTLVHVLAGGVTARVGGEEEPFELATDDTLWALDTGADEVIDLTGRSPDALVVVVRAHST